MYFFPVEIHWASEFLLRLLNQPNKNQTKDALLSPGNPPGICEKRSLAQPEGRLLRGAVAPAPRRAGARPLRGEGPRRGAGRLGRGVESGESGVLKARVGEPTRNGYGRQKRFGIPFWGR